MTKSLVNRQIRAGLSCWIFDLQMLIVIERIDTEYDLQLVFVLLICFWWEFLSGVRKIRHSGIMQYQGCTPAAHIL